MKVFFSKFITKKWITHLEVWVAKKHSWVTSSKTLYMAMFDPTFF